MTEFDKADLDSNGKIDRYEWDKLELEDRRLEVIDRESIKRIKINFKTQGQVY